MNTKVAALLGLTLAMVLSYQNCAPGFVGKDLSISEFGSSAEPGDDEPGAPLVDSTYDGKAVGNFVTSEKTIPDSTTPVVLSWDLGTEFTSGVALKGSKFSVEISKFTPVDGTPVYFVTKPTLTTSTQAIDISDLRIGVDGIRNDVSTTFQGLKQTIAVGATSVLSTATLLHEISGATQQHKLSLHFRKLWPNGVALPTTPTPTPMPALNGAALYAQHCASCHGALATSAKRGRSSQQITNSFTSAPSMSFLSTVLSAQDVDAISAALK